MPDKENAGFECPIPISDYPNVLLAHGGGGRLMHQLLEKVFLPTFDNPELNTRHDSARLNVGGVKLAFTTDSYVVHPLFFPGGDIGSLAVHGTVNDLAMSGARPLCMSAGYIIEEGLPMETLWRVARSMQSAAMEAGVKVVTGDTKVVDRGKGDGIFINTSGIGVIEHNLDITPKSVREGDAIIINGDIGRHGMAIMAVREGLEFESAIESDSAALAGIVLRLIDAGIDIHCLRDLTRGGLASALNEIADSSGLGIEVDESWIPVRDDVAGACEILGFDPMYVANEGRFIAFVPEAEAGRALDLMKGHALGEGASIIGKVGGKGSPSVKMRSKIGTMRIVTMITGEQLPRIC